MIFPCEILFHICASNQMADALAFMQSCKRVYHYFSHHDLIRVRRTLYTKEKMMRAVCSLTPPPFLNRHRDNSKYQAFMEELQLDPWMLEPAPLHPETHGPLIERILTLVKSRGYDLYFPERERFITGGAICQAAFGLKWESDLDIFMACQGDEVERREKATHSQNKQDEQEVDAIYKKIPQGDDITSVLRRFDISLCQVGVRIGGPTGSLTQSVPVVVATPLFLCSFHFGFAAVQVSDLSCTYGPNDERLEIADKFEKHILFYNYQRGARGIGIHHEDFVSCKLCLWELEYGHYAPECHYARWVERVKKYQVRFPQFKFRYYSERKGKGVP
jgi:hypothetical protein